MAQVYDLCQPYGSTFENLNQSSKRYGHKLKKTVYPEGFQVLETLIAFLFAKIRTIFFSSRKTLTLYQNKQNANNKPHIRFGL
jgi:hypothetical protein